MDKAKKAYVDSRFRTSDSVSDGGFEFELKNNRWIYQIILFVMPMTFQFLTHGEQPNLITTSFT